MSSNPSRPPLNAFMQSFALLVLRIGIGGLMLYGHGLVKLGNFAELVDRFADPIGLGSGTSLVLVILAEVVCAILVILGLYTRLAVVPLVIMLMVALVFVHPGDPWAKIELALLYLVPFSALFISGGGWYSLDNVLRRRKRRTASSIPAPPADITSDAPVAIPDSETVSKP